MPWNYFVTTNTLLKMIKIITTIIAVYLLYYAGNMVYDLFLKKDNSGRSEETEEYSLTEFSEKDKNEIKNGVQNIYCKSPLAISLIGHTIGDIVKIGNLDNFVEILQIKNWI